SGPATRDLIAHLPADPPARYENECAARSAILPLSTDRDAASLRQGRHGSPGRAADARGVARFGGAAGTCGLLGRPVDLGGAAAGSASGAVRVAARWPTCVLRHGADRWTRSDPGGHGDFTGRAVRQHYPVQRGLARRPVELACLCSPRNGYGDENDS